MDYRVDPRIRDEEFDRFCGTSDHCEVRIDVEADAPRAIRRPDERRGRSFTHTTWVELNIGTHVVEIRW